MDKCSICGKDIPYFSGTMCQECSTRKMTADEKVTRENEQAEKEAMAEFNEIPVVSIPELPNKKILKYFDIISAEVVIGTGFLSELTAGIADFLGTTADSYEEKIFRAKQMALIRLKYQAQKLGANAVIGANTDYVVTINNMFMYSVSGTPVTLGEMED